MKHNLKHSKYFEVWGDLLSHSNTMKYVLLGAILCNIIQLFFIYLLSSRPPMIIRIDKLGNSDIVKNYITESLNITEDDVSDFTRRFINNYTAVRSDHVTYQMKEAINMMTDRYQKQHLKNLKETNIIEEIQIANIRNEVIFNEMNVDQSGGNVYVEIDAVLKTQSLTNLSEKAEEKHIVIRMALKKVKKTANTPFGLLVKAYKLDFDDNPEIGGMHEDK